MIGNQWSLVIFTLLIQTAVGVYITSLIINRIFNKRLGEESAYKLTIANQYVIGLLAIVGLVVSVFHLGYPFNAPKAILNIGSSWLSREIAFTGAFVFLSLLTILIMSKKKRLPVGLAIITSVVGLATIFVMSKVYSTVLVPAWQSEFTIITFYGTCFMLGTLLAIGLVIFSANRAEGINASEVFRGTLLPLSLIVIIAMAVQIIALPGYMISLSAQGGAAQTTAQIITNDYGVMLALRWVFVLFSSVILFFMAFKQQVSVAIGQGQVESAATGGAKLGAAANYIYLAVVAMIVGEVLGRHLFYTTGVQIMIGG